MKARRPSALTRTLTSRSLPADTTYAEPLPDCDVKPMAHGLAKNSRFLPASGLRAPRWRLRKRLGAPSRSRSWRTPLTTLTKACVSTLKRSGPSGEAAMLGR